MADVKRKYDSTVARIAGNLLSGISPDYSLDRLEKIEQQRVTAQWAVEMARAIVAEVERTEPQA
jgi:hypothetical protein